MRAPKLTAESLTFVFIDLQEGIVNVGTTTDVERLRTAVGALADLSQTFAIPLVVSCVPTTGGSVAPVLAEITARAAGVPALVRTTADAMDDPGVRAALDAAGRKTLVIAGIATEVAVRQSALSAVRDGFHAVVAVDACSGLDPRTESAALMHLSASGVELSAVATIAAELAGDFRTAAGQAAMRALQSTLVRRGHDRHAHDTHDHHSHDDGDHHTHD